MPKAVKLAELLGMPVTQARQMYANFPEPHPLWVGGLPAGTLNSITWPKDSDVVINVGNKLQHNSPAPIVPRNKKFIDMRIDHWSMGNVMLTEVPLVADVGYGLDDLIAAVEQLLTPALKQKFAERAEEVKKFTTQARALRAGIVNSPDWDQAPIIADRLTYEISRFADPDAIIVHEAGSVSLHGFGFNPIGGRELFFYYGAHLGSGVGTAAGVKLARPNQQVICLVGDGSFMFGPTALWNMARLELPVITVVYNNHAYSGPHSRAISPRSERAHGADRPVLSRLSRQPGHGHGGDRQRLRRRRRGRAESGAVARGARARPQAHGRRQALPARRPGRPQRHRLGGEALGPADPDRGPAHQKGLRSVIRTRRFAWPEKFRPCAFLGMALASACVALSAPAHAEAAPTPEQIDQGREVYEDNCQTCHGRDMVSPGLVTFDLRKFPKDDPARFRGAVLDGKGAAMPAFRGRISDEEVDLLWAYVRGGP